MFSVIVSGIKDLICNAIENTLAFLEKTANFLLCIVAKIETKIERIKQLPDETRAKAVVALQKIKLILDCAIKKIDEIIAKIDDKKA